MSILREVLRTLLKMFLADAWLSGGLILVVAVAAGLVGVSQWLGGAVLLLGTLAVLLLAVRAEARRR